MRSAVRIRLWETWLLSLAVLSSSPSLGADIYVRAGADAGNGEQPTPFDTIAAALEAAQEGDTIRIAEGAYPEKILVGKNQVKLKGGYDSTFEGDRDSSKHQVTLDGQGKFRPVQIGADGQPVKKFQIDGVTIANGLADGVEESDGKGGGLLIAGGSSGKISRCQFLDNRAADDGGAIENSGNGTVKIDRCLFRGNSAGDDGGAIRLQGSGSATTISNCIFHKNSGLDKYVIQAKGDTRILHCTFFENTADSRGIIASRSKLGSENANVQIANCIFALNHAMDDDPLLFADDESVPIDVKNCLFFKNDADGGLGENIEMGSNGHIDGDPMFVDAAAGDFRVSDGSPVIDGAMLLDVVKKDYSGKARGNGSGPDIGAFEH